MSRKKQSSCHYVKDANLFLIQTIRWNLITGGSATVKVLHIRTRNPAPSITWNGRPSFRVSSACFLRVFMKWFFKKGEGQEYGRGKGKNKRSAEEAAAKEALGVLDRSNQWFLQPNTLSLAGARVVSYLLVIIL